VRGEPRREERRERARVDALAQLHERDDLLVGPVRATDHRAQRDGRVRQQRRLDVGRVDRVARALDHVLDASGEVQRAALVEAPDVAGAEPAVGGERRARRGRVAEVAGEHVGTADDDLADLPCGDRGAGVVDQAHAHARQRPADRVSRRGSSIAVWHTTAVVSVSP
jgi:hypothetical protein